MMLSLGRLIAMLPHGIGHLNGTLVVTNCFNNSKKYFSSAGGSGSGGTAEDGVWRGSTEFGFETVSSPDDKTQRVKEVFRSVADQYDLMNDLMSVGVHRHWKNSFVDSLKLKPPMDVLDVAGGTGDIAFRCAAVLNQPQISRNMLFPEVTAVRKSSVTVVDINESMLEVGENRAVEAGIYSKGQTDDFSNRNCSLHFMVGNAEELSQIEDNSKDVYTIAFGLRNVARIPLALKEAQRVLKRGGRFACLEFSHVDVPVLDKLYETYNFNVIPEVGRMVTGDRDSYQYLVESIARFPKRHELLEMLVEAGFRSDAVQVETMTGGIVAIHSAFKV